MNEPSTSASEDSHYLESATQPAEVCNRYIYDPAVRRHYSMNFSDRPRQRKEEFNAGKFLSDRHREHNYSLLRFQPEQDSQAEWAAMQSDSDRQRIAELADGVLRKIAEHVENLSRMYNYRLLEVHYEKSYL